MAVIFPFIFLRSRNTRERLPRASDRFPPALLWMAMTIEKKLVSAIGTRCAIRSMPSDKVNPIESDSTILRPDAQAGQRELRQPDRGCHDNKKREQQTS